MLLVSTHRNGHAIRLAIHCQALSDRCWKLWRSFWLLVTLYFKKAGNQNLTKCSSGTAGIIRYPTVSHLWQQNADFKCTPSQVLASDLHLHCSAPAGWLLGYGKLLTSKMWHLSSLANDRASSGKGWMRSLLLPCTKKRWLPALSKQAGQQLHYQLMQTI